MEFSKENFRVILVGKDGGVKRQDTTPVRATTIFEQIDAMPMRQQEMHSSRQKVAIKYKRVKVRAGAIASASPITQRRSLLPIKRSRSVRTRGNRPIATI